MDILTTRDQDLTMMGLKIGARMTVVRLSDNKLLVHSPIKPTPKIITDLKAMGDVAYVVAPNKWHHIYLSDFKNQYPNAAFFGAQGLDTKKPGFVFERMITNEQNYPWNPQLSHVVIEGAPSLNEVVFVHHATKTLILTDLVLHVCKTDSLYTKFVLSLIGAYKNFGWSKAEKIFFIRDKAAFRKSIDKVLEYEFDRVIMSHGDIVTTNGRQLLQDAFRTL